MGRLRAFATSFLFACQFVQASADDARSSEAALKSFALADGLTIELVAAEPLTASPCAMAFDERGRLFVAENRGYPRTAEPPQGTIALLEDADGDGRMDKRTVFAEGLTFPNGVMPWKDGLIVTCAPDLLYLRDTDGDGRADERRVLLTGFATTGSTQLRVNAPILGPDGWIWLASGLSGGQIRNPSQPELGTVEMKGDLRFDPLTGRFESVDGRSQYGHSFDADGNRFICMNRIQVQHVVLPSSHLRRNPNLAFSETVQNCPELVPNPLLRVGGGAARIFPISANITTADSHAGTFSAACAVTIWDGGGALPDAYRNVAFSCDPTGNLIHADKLERRGATFAAKSMFPDREFLASRDDWFRPVFLATGPDGSLYVCDMYRKVIEHPDYLPGDTAKSMDFEAGKDMGRIWRIRSRGARPKPFTAFPDAKDKLGTLLTDANPWIRATARRLLLERRETGEELNIPGTPEQALNAQWLQTRHLLSPLKEDELIAASGTSEGAALALKIVSADVDSGRYSTALLQKIADQALTADSPALLPLVIAAGAVRDDSAAVPLLIKAGRRSMPDDRWLAAALTASAAGREYAVLRGLLSEDSLRREDGTPPGILLTLLAETLGRADEKTSADSLESLLVELHGAAYATRATLTAAYAKGRGAPLHPDREFVTTLLEETERNVQREGVDQAAAIAVLAYAPWEIGGAHLLQLAGEGNRDALHALVRWDRTEIPEALLKSTAFMQGPAQLREEILALSFGRPSFHPVVLQAIENTLVTAAAISPQRRKLLLESEEATVRERAGKLFALPEGDRKAAFEKAKAALLLTGRSQAGRGIFNQACAICHRLERAGFAVGPDLFDIRNQPKESILLHIVVPDAEIAPGFAAYIGELKDGRSVSGVQSSETAESITLRSPGGAEQTILRGELKHIAPMPNSLMPSGMEAAMTDQEMADLLAYLKGEA